MKQEDIDSLMINQGLKITHINEQNEELSKQKEKIESQDKLIEELKAQLE